MEKESVTQLGDRELPPIAASSNKPNDASTFNATSFLASAVVGAVLGGSIAVITDRLRQRRATRQYFSSLLRKCNDVLAGMPFDYKHLARHPVSGWNTSNAVVLVGEHRAGTTAFLANHLVKERYPWWQRVFFPAYGLYLKGNQYHESIDAWLRDQLRTPKEDSYPWRTLKDMMVFQRRTNQRTRSLLHQIFKQNTPAWLRPQPVVIIVDQAELLLRAYRGPALLKLGELVKYACEYNLFHLVLVVNTDHALKALTLLNEGRVRVDVIRAPKVSKDAVAQAYPADFVEAFEDCNSCIGIALDYMRFADRQKETARAYTARNKEEYLRWSCLTEEISLDEFCAGYRYKKKE